MQKSGDSASSETAISETEIWRDGSLVAYDRVPYGSDPYPQSHPDRAATIARLLGVSPPAVETARILELGCAGGGNLLPMAEQLPRATLLGIDGSRKQIEFAEELRRRAGLDNVELRHQDIATFDDREPFDYVIAHGVYSWVPPEVQQSLLRVIGDSLGTEGIAYVSYNAYPGWHLLEMVREIMLFAAQPFDDPRERLSRAKDYLTRLVDARQEDDPLRKLLAEELQSIQHDDPSYLLHDHLERHNAPVYFHQFIERAAQYGLAYLGEADFGQTDRENLSEKIRTEMLEFSDDPIRAEQHIDFRLNNTFRQTLLCRTSIRPDRRFTSVDWDRFVIATDAVVDTAPLDVRSRAPVHFRREQAVLRTRDPFVKAVLLLLSEAWPGAIAFAELAQGAGRMVGFDSPEKASRRLARLARLAFGASIVDVRTSMPRLRAEPSERPRASAVARAQAEMGPCVTNLLHSQVNLDELKLSVLASCDGRRDCAGVVRHLIELAGLRDAPAHLARFESSELHDQVQTRVDDTLEGLARMALLIE